jgi:uncharacterized integral membrane protein
VANPGPPYPPPPPPGSEPAGPEPSPGPKRAVSTGQILGGVLLILVVIFILENSREVKVRLIIPEVKAPLYVAILIAAVLGALIAWLLRYRRHRHHPPR